MKKVVVVGGAGGTLLTMLTIVGIVAYNLFGITSWRAARGAWDRMRSNESLVQEHRDLTVSKASQVQDFTNRARQAEQSLQAAESELRQVELRLEESKGKVGFMAKTCRDSCDGKVFVGKIQIDRAEAMKDLEAEVANHDRLESFKERLESHIVVLKKVKETLEKAINEGRVELATMRSNGEMFALADSLPQPEADPNSIEGDVLKSQQRPTEIELVMVDRGMTFDSVKPKSDTQRWDRWSKGNLEQNDLLARADDIMGNTSPQNSLTRK